MNVLRKVHGSLIPGGVLLDLQPLLADAPVVGPGGFLGSLDEGEFRAIARRVAGALDETIRSGWFVREREIVCDATHRFESADELLDEVANWTGTAIPEDLRGRLQKAAPPFDVREGARLVVMRARHG